MRTRVDTKTATERAQGGPIVGSVHGTLFPLGIGEVRITGGFWGARQEINASATLTHCLSWMERLGWIANFDRVAAGTAGVSKGREFADSEVYKLIEAMAWESARSGESWVEETYQELVARVLAAQQLDGYLNTRFGGPEQPERYSDLEWGHELYCAGHFIQAAVARARTKGVAEPLVSAAIRLADLVCTVFGPDGIDGVCGHPEIETALVELHRVTGTVRYLDQARLFIERRGHGLLADPEVPPAYFVDDLPVRDAAVLRGHAVRALYLAAGAVDVAIETGDADLLDALSDQWTNTVARRTYLTGGMGSRHEGESFGDDFELPSDRAYSETCAGVGSIMFSWRMLLAQGDERYADLIERTLYNVVATSPDEHGTAFFYVNPLQRDTPGIEPDPTVASARAASSQRAPWFEVSCCPTNVARTLASLSGYVATTDASGLQLHQYVPSEIRASLPDGRRIALHVETNYPIAGEVALHIDSDSIEPWTLSLRIPRWADGLATLTVGGDTQVGHGSTVSVTRAFRRGEIIVLQLPVEPRITEPDSRIDGVRDSVAVEAGPVVYCVESTDQDGLSPHEILFDRSRAPHFDSSEPGVVFASGRLREELPGTLDEWPYRSAGRRDAIGHFLVRFTPYYHWAERGPSTMRVFVPLDHSAEPGGADSERE